jgi:excisionase family DNA binding protein
MPITPDPGHEHQLVFTSSQAARYLGVSLATVRRWTDAGYLTCYRTPGGQRRFSREQLDGFIDSLHRTEGAPSRSDEAARQHSRVA